MSLEQIVGENRSSRYYRFDFPGSPVRIPSEGLKGHRNSNG
jgi:hypothetical protein